jgi:hypothetical protein
MATNGSTDTQIISGVNGSGTYLPLSFYTNNALAAQISTAGVFSATGGIAASSMPSGSVVQVVYTSTTSQATYTRGTTMTPFTTVITPSSASSRIIIMLTIALSQDSGADIGINVIRNSTDIQTGSGGSNTNSTFIPCMSFGAGNLIQQTLTVVDSPATTSAITYSFINYVNSGRTAYLNRRGQDTTYACSSSVVLMEVK